MMVQIYVTTFNVATPKSNFTENKLKKNHNFFLQQGKKCSFAPRFCPSQRSCLNLAFENYCKPFICQLIPIIIGIF